MLFQTVLYFKLEGYRLPSLASRPGASRACQQFIVFVFVGFFCCIQLGDSTSCGVITGVSMSSRSEKFTDIITLSSNLIIQGIFVCQHLINWFCAVSLWLCLAPKCRFFWDSTSCCAMWAHSFFAVLLFKLCFVENCILMHLFSICRFPLLFKLQSWLLQKLWCCEFR